MRKGGSYVMHGEPGQQQAIVPASPNYVGMYPSAAVAAAVPVYNNNNNNNYNYNYIHQNEGTNDNQPITVM